MKEVKERRPNVQDAMVDNLKWEVEDMKSKLEDLKSELDSHQDIFRAILSAVTLANGTTTISTLVSIILKMPDRPERLEELFNFQSFNGYVSLESMINNPAIAQVRISDDFMKTYLEKRVEGKIQPWLSAGSGNCSFEKALVKLTRTKFTRGTHAIGPSPMIPNRYGPVVDPDWKGKYEDGIPKGVQFNIDATKFRALSVYGGLPSNAAIIFNCPWTTDGQMVGEFLVDVMQSASKVQVPGSYLFLGITEHEHYFMDYELSTLLKNSGEKYCLTHIDNGIIHDVRKGGYKHHSVKKGADLEYILDKHVMLCFQRVKTIEEANEEADEELVWMHCQESLISSGYKIC
ncbi:hypothetical protein HDU80_009906 [Chytriomyces hyalinus]|nr:hypothetical protein HDU80_009906 [Chytriomyces hyalinus]